MSSYKVLKLKILPIQFLFYSLCKFKVHTKELKKTKCKYQNYISKNLKNIIFKFF